MLYTNDSYVVPVCVCTAAVHTSTVVEVKYDIKALLLPLIEGYGRALGKNLTQNSENKARILTLSELEFF